MIYPAELEQKLGFDQIRQKLKSLCLSQAAAALADEMHFSTDVTHIKTSLLQNIEFLLLLEKSEDFPSRYFFDPAEWLVKIALAGNYLDEPELLNFAYAMQTIIASKSFLT